MTDAAELRRAPASCWPRTRPPTTDRLDFLRARFDAGLAWVHYPEGLGGLDAPRSLQAVVDAEFAAAGAPDNDPRRIGIGLGMAAPTILRYGTDEQQQRFLRPLWTGEEVWCQLFSEPGAGSDLAALGTRAVRDGDDWVVNGQKVWTSSAHQARWAILIARTDPDVPKHRGITYFVCDMTAPGVEVRPLRQITGEAEFNEVFLTDVRIPDAHRLGEVGEGWRVAQTTLMNERVAIGGGALPREGGMIGLVAATWRDRPELRTPGLHERLLRLWVDAEAARLTGERLRQQLAAGQPGPEGSAMKLAFARLNQEICGAGAGTARRGGPALRRLDACAAPSWSTSPAATPATATCAPRATRSRAAPPRSCSTSSPSACSGLPAEPRTDKDVAVEGPAPMSTAGPALLRGRGRRCAPPCASLLADRCRPGRRPRPRRDRRRRTTPSCGSRSPPRSAPRGCSCPRSSAARAPASREAAVVLEELGRAVAPVPYLTSAVLATERPARLRHGEDADAARRRSADGDRSAVARGPARRPAGPPARPPVRYARTATALTGRVTQCRGRARAPTCCSCPPATDGLYAVERRRTRVASSPGRLARPDPAPRRRHPRRRPGAAAWPTRGPRATAVARRCSPAPDCSPPSSSASPSGAWTETVALH